MHFFGSTAKRFKTEKSTTDDIGPGYYMNEKKSFSQKHFRKPQKIKEKNLSFKGND